MNSFKIKVKKITKTGVIRLSIIQANWFKFFPTEKHCFSTFWSFIKRCLPNVQLFTSPRTVAHQVPLFLEFYRKEYWKGNISISLLQGIFPTQGSNPGHLHCRQQISTPQPAIHAYIVCPKLIQLHTNTPSKAQLGLF